jgi:hypothetical protein
VPEVLPQLLEVGHEARDRVRPGSGGPAAAALVVAVDGGEVLDHARHRPLSEYGPYVSEALVTASRTQGEPVYMTRMLPEQGAYMQETRGDPQFTHGYYEVLLKDPALPY